MIIDYSLIKNRKLIFGKYRELNNMESQIDENNIITTKLNDSETRVKSFNTYLDETELTELINKKYDTYVKHYVTPKQVINDYVETTYQPKVVKTFFIKKHVQPKPTYKYIQKDKIKKQGFSILGQSAQSFDEKFFTSLVYCPFTADSYHNMLIIGNETLAPIILKSPANFEEMVDLVSTDPRYISEIECGKLNVEEYKQIIKTAIDGIDKIFEYQKDLNVVYDLAERMERNKFTKECLGKIEEFKKIYVEQQHLNAIKENVVRSL